MATTWEEVMLGIDVRREQQSEAKEYEDIMSDRAKEERLAKAWSFGLSLLGGALLGPAGYAIGKIAGRYGVDEWGGIPGLKGFEKSMDWEDRKVPEGKFYKSKSDTLNRELNTLAKDDTSKQTLATILDLGNMYIQAGGLQEGFDPSFKEFTSFGTGDEAWTLFGSKDADTWASEGAGGMLHPDTGEILGTAPRPYSTQSLFSEGFKGAFTNLKDAYLASQGNLETVAGSLLPEIEKTKAETKAKKKPKGKTVRSVGQNYKGKG